MSNPATQARALLHTTPNGGLAILSGRQDEFDAIPCEHFPGDGEDTFIFDGGDDGDLILSAREDGEEFSEVGA